MADRQTRTGQLSEIQLRLAALEEMLADERRAKDTPPPDRPRS